MFSQNEKRILNAMDKIKKGEPVTIITLGGSITTGYASNPIKEKSWAATVGRWFLSKSTDKSKIKYINQGVSGTDSAFAVVRVENHVKKYNPDLVILEFAMNDQWLEEKVRCRTYEGVIRKMTNGTSCGVLALFVNERKHPFSGQQFEQEKICNHYGIPFVSWKDCLFNKTNIKYFESFFDGEETIHPNNEGHKSIASFIEEKLESYWVAARSPSDCEFSKEIVKPLYKDNFEKAEYFTNDNISPCGNSNYENTSPVHSEWVEHGNEKYGWQTDKSNSEISFKIKAKTIGITYCESDKFFDEESWVTFENGTESKKVKLECFNSIRNNYLGWAYRTILDGEEEKSVTLHVKSLHQDEGFKYSNFTGIIINR